MESLYAILIKGSMFYVIGNISAENCEKIALLARNFKSSETDCKSVCHEFIEVVDQSLGITLEQIPVSFVFRIK